MTSAPMCRCGLLMGTEPAGDGTPYLVCAHCDYPCEAGAKCRRCSAIMSNADRKDSK